MKEDAVEIGVGPALEWLKRKDAAARGDIDRVTLEMDALRAERQKHLPEDDGREWNHEMRCIQDDLDYLHKVSDKYRTDLLKFEKGVVPEKRVAGESIQQGEGARIIEMAVVHLRLGWEQVKLVASQSLPLCKTEIEALEKLAPIMDTCLVNAVDNAVSEGALPAWVSASAKAGL